MSKRSIRLREFERCVDKIITPSELYTANKRHLSHLKSYQLQTDQDAFICSGRNIAADKRICFIGGSFVENKFVDQGSRWFSFLEALLLNYGESIEVLNAGYSGATSLNILNTIINKIVNNDIDAIYYCISSNDHSALSYEHSYWNTTKNHSNLLLSEYHDDKKGEMNRFDFEAVLKSIHAICVNFDVAIKFLTYPNLCNDQRLTYINDALRYVCNKYGYSLIDMDLLMQPHKANFEKLFHDENHLNEQGSELFAQLLFDHEFYSADHPQKLSLLNTQRVDLQNLVDKDFIEFNLTHFGQNASLVFDIFKQVDHSDSLLVQLLSSEDIKEIQQDFEFSNELGWYAWIDINHLQVQIRKTITLPLPRAESTIRLSLKSGKVLNNAISRVSLECY